MAYTESHKKATIKYMKNNLDDIKIRVQKGKREEYKKIAQQLGYKSLTSFIIQAINEKIEKEMKQ